MADKILDEINTLATAVTSRFDDIEGKMKALEKAGSAVLPKSSPFPPLTIAFRSPPLAPMLSGLAKRTHVPKLPLPRSSN